MVLFIFGLRLFCAKDILNIGFNLASGLPQFRNVNNIVRDFAFYFFPDITIFTKVFRELAYQLYRVCLRDCTVKRTPLTLLTGHSQSLLYVHCAYHFNDRENVFSDSSEQQ